MMDAEAFLSGSTCSPATSALPVSNQVYYRCAVPTNCSKKTYAQWRLDLN